MQYTEGSIRNTEFFTTSELAQKLKMNVQVITRKVQAGEIEAFKIGKDWRIPEEAVFEWLQRNSNMKNDRKGGNGTSSEQTPPDRQPADSPIETLPAQPSRRKHLLEYILAQFEPNRLYSEAEVNNVIHRHHDDHDAVRGEFVSEQMMEEIDGKYRRRVGYTFSE